MTKKKPEISISEAINRVFNSLNSLDVPALQKLVDEHANGEFAQTLIYANYFDSANQKTRSIEPWLTQDAYDFDDALIFSTGTDLFSGWENRFVQVFLGSTPR